MTPHRRMRTRPAWWLAVMESGVLLPVVKLLLLAGGYGRTRALLARTSRASHRPPTDPHGPVPTDLLVLASAVTAVAALPPLRSRCLARSLGLWWLARRRGHDVTFVMGVAPPVDGTLDAHAWVEYGDTPLNDTADVRTRYSALPSPRERAD